MQGGDYLWSAYKYSLTPRFGGGVGKAAAPPKGTSPPQPAAAATGHATSAQSPEYWDAALALESSSSATAPAAPPPLPPPSQQHQQQRRDPTRPPADLDLLLASPASVPPPQQLRTVDVGGSVEPPPQLPSDPSTLGLGVLPLAGNSDPWVQPGSPLADTADTSLLDAPAQLRLPSPDAEPAGLTEVAPTATAASAVAAVSAPHAPYPVRGPYADIIDTYRLSAPVVGALGGAGRRERGTGSGPY